jgi:DNA-binding XRE family transcriptional regulator
VRTKFLKRRIYGYFYNNLRIKKPEKLTREELNDYYRKERVNRSIEYQTMMEENGWTKADLARHLGVSRAWVTIVMRELETYLASVKDMFAAIAFRSFISYIIA